MANETNRKSMELTKENSERKFRGRKLILDWGNLNIEISKLPYNGTIKNPSFELFGSGVLLANVYENEYGKLVDEMERRGYTVRNEDWWNRFYRGKKLGYADGMKSEGWYGIIIYPNPFEKRIYPEHDEKYLDECIANLAAKGVKIDRDKAVKRIYG